MGSNLVVLPHHIETALEQLADGASLAAVARQLGVKRRTLREAIRRVPGALERYEAARQDGADSLAEEIVSIADTEKDAQVAKVRVDARKWLASKWLPKIYGEKLDLTVNQQVDLKGALEEAKARAGLQHMRDNAIDAEVVERKTEAPTEPPLPRPERFPRGEPPAGVDIFS